MEVENTSMKNYSGTTSMSDKQTMRTVTPQPRHVPDAYAPAVFNGIYPDPESWLAHMRRYASYRQMDEADQLAAFPLFLKDSAIDWFDTLDQETKHSMEQLLEEFQNFFCPSPLDHVLNAESTAGTATTGSNNGDIAEIRDEIRANRVELQHLTTRQDRMTTNVVSSRTPSPHGRTSQRRVMWADGLSRSPTQF